MIQIFTFFLFFFFVAQAWPNTYWASNGGHGDAPSDSYNCTQAQNQSTPFITINKAVACLASAPGGPGGGHTVNIRSGTYHQSIDTLAEAPITGASSFSNAPVIQGYPQDGNRAVIIDGDNGFAARMGTGFDPTISAWVIWKNLWFKGTFTKTNVVNIGANFQRFDNVEVSDSIGAPNQSVLMSLPSLTGGVEFLNCSVHNSNSRTDGVTSGYAFYIEGNNNLMDNCDVYDNGGYGIHLYHTGDNNVSNNIIRNSRFWGNGHSGTVGSQILLSHGSNNQFYNNVVYAPGRSDIYGILIQSDCFSCVFQNNDVIGHGSVGGVYSGLNIANAYNTIVRNNIFANNAAQITLDPGEGTILDHNLCSTSNGCLGTSNQIESMLNTFVSSNPQVSRDFRLKSTSLAVNNGTNTGCPTPDGTQPVGIARPQTGVCDIGAFEFAGTGPPSTIPTITITSPTPNPTYPTPPALYQSNTITLGGTATP